MLSLVSITDARIPLYIGGFVTTDIRNMMEDPKIIERIAKAVTTVRMIKAIGWMDTMDLQIALLVEQDLCHW